MSAIVRAGKPFLAPATPLKAVTEGKKRCGMCGKPVNSLKRMHKTRSGFPCVGARYVEEIIVG